MAGELKNKRVLVVDNGLYFSWARTLQDYGAKVDYFCPWIESAPKTAKKIIGMGHPGIKRVESWEDREDEYDLFFFCDIYFADQVERLRNAGKRVWGAGRGECMELDRWQFKKDMHKVGLPVQPSWKITGCTALREFLTENEDKFIKISTTRGEFETFHHKDIKSSEEKLTIIEHRLGAYKEDQEFIVEDSIKSIVELGYDGTVIDGRFPKFVMQGVEIKNCGLLGVIKEYDKLPEELKIVNEKLSPMFKTYRYRGQLSTEVRVSEAVDGMLQVNGHTPYLIDMTCRAPCPPTEAQQCVFSNWDEHIWLGAIGEMRNLKPVSKYAVQAVIRSEEARQIDIAIHIKDDVRDFVKIFNHFHKDGIDYFIDQGDAQGEIGYVVGLGNTIKDAFEDLKKNADGIDCCGLDIDLDSISKAVEEIKKGDDHGIHFTDDKLPDLTKV